MSLFAFGLGFCAARVVVRGRLGAAAGTARSEAAVAAWRARGVEAFVFDGARVGEGLGEALARSPVVLVSAPPDAAGDPVLRVFAGSLRPARAVYLSTVGVYGDSAGAWVDETSPLKPALGRARARVAAETAWRELGRKAGFEVDILRLGGIYGPGRGAFDRLREGTARRVVKPGQVFNRIHVDDVALAVESVVAAGRPGDFYNVVDGAPSTPQDVIAYAAELIGVPPPPEEPYETAGLTGMAASFYEENRRVKNDRLRALGWAPQFPTFREGLRATLAEEAAGGG